MKFTTLQVIKQSVAYYNKLRKGITGRYQLKVRSGVINNPTTRRKNYSAELYWSEEGRVYRSIFCLSQLIHTIFEKLKDRDVNFYSSIEIVNGKAVSVIIFH